MFEDKMGWEISYIFIMNKSEKNRKKRKEEKMKGVGF